MKNQKPKILIISYCFPPLNVIASLRVYSWAKYWSRMGYEVCVLTAKKTTETVPLIYRSVRTWRRWCGLRKHHIVFQKKPFHPKKGNDLSPVKKRFSIISAAKKSVKK